MRGSSMTGFVLDRHNPYTGWLLSSEKRGLSSEPVCSTLLACQTRRVLRSLTEIVDKSRFSIESSAAETGIFHRLSGSSPNWSFRRGYHDAVSNNRLRYRYRKFIECRILYRSICRGEAQSGRNLADMVDDSRTASHGVDSPVRGVRRKDRWGSVGLSRPIYSHQRCPAERRRIVVPRNFQPTGTRIQFCVQGQADSGFIQGQGKRELRRPAVGI